MWTVPSAWSYCGIVGVPLKFTAIASICKLLFPLQDYVFEIYQGNTTYCLEVGLKENKRMKIMHDLDTYQLWESEGNRMQRVKVRF